MRKVICQPCGMVHVAMREENVVYRYDLIGGLAHVKADIELRYGNYGFFASYRIPDYIQIIDRYFV